MKSKNVPFWLTNNPFTVSEKGFKINPFFGKLIVLLVFGVIALCLVGIPLLLGHIVWFVSTSLHWSEGVWSGWLKWSVGFLLMLITGGLKIGNIHFSR